jgi:hypothetical protein
MLSLGAEGSGGDQTIRAKLRFEQFDFLRAPSFLAPGSCCHLHLVALPCDRFTRRWRARTAISMMVGDRIV